MGHSNKLSTDELLFSCVYGRGIYQSAGQMVQDPLGGDNGGGHFSPLLRNVITGEEFYMKCMDCSPQLREKYQRRITRPPVRKHILWPVDMVDLTDKNTGCSLYVHQEYTDTPAEIELKDSNLGLLFPYGGYPSMVNGVRRLQQIGTLSWKKREIRRIAVQIVKAIDSINRCGYVYEDIHLSRIFFLENDEVYLNFSGLALSMEDVFAENASEICAVHGNEYPIEFADPAVYRGLQKNLDFQAQNFSLTALLFYLFMGQYPYDGRLLTGYVDDSIQHHYIKFRDYIKMPVFIFDPDDRQNALGAFAEEEAVVELWKDLPEQLRQMFVSTLRQANAERTDSQDNPTPGMWLDCFRLIGWNDSMEVQ